MKISEISGNGLVVETYDNRQERDKRGQELRKLGKKTGKNSRCSNPFRPADRFELSYRI